MRREVTAVLGIDAAWTDHQPSGVALLQRSGAKWKCLCIGPSYAAFNDGFAWSDRFIGAACDAGSVVAACRQRLEDVKPVVVAVDMPLATTRIYRRRHADDLISQQFGHRKCSVHSPTPARPGSTGRRLQKGFFNAGYSLATTVSCRLPALLEVYPHVALLGLTGRGERLPYKTGRTSRYWPEQSIEQRKLLLIEEWQFILERLGAYIDDIDLPLPNPLEYSFEYLKRFEDAIDGLVCAWVATQFLDKSAVALGDKDAAIWIPLTSLQFAKEAHGA